MVLGDISLFRKGKLNQLDNFYLGVFEFGKLFSIVKTGSQKLASCLKSDFKSELHFIDASCVICCISYFVRRWSMVHECFSIKHVG